MGRYEEEIVVDAPSVSASYDKALEINPDDHLAWYNQGAALLNLGRNEEAIVVDAPSVSASFDKALEIKADYYEAWSWRGYAFLGLKQYEQAFASFEQELKFNYGSGCYDKACYYAVLGEIQEAIANLKLAIQKSPEEYIERAKTDSDFDNIRHDSRFQEVLKIR